MRVPWHTTDQVLGEGRNTSCFLMFSRKGGKVQADRGGKADPDGGQLQATKVAVERILQVMVVNWGPLALEGA